MVMPEPQPLHRSMPEDERLRRGLVNGYRVTMARELCGHNRMWLSRRLGWEGTAELRAREASWTFWTPVEMATLERELDFPLAFFVHDDPPDIFGAGGFLCKTAPPGEESACEVIPPRPPRASPWRQTLTRRERARLAARPKKR